MEKADLKPYLGHVCSSVGHLIINALSTIVSQGEILRTLGPGDIEHSLEVDQRIDTLIRTSLDAAGIMRRLVDLSHEWISVEIDRPESAADPVHLDQLLAELIAAEKDRLAPSASWELNLASVPAIPGQVEALRVMFRLFLANAVEALPEGKGIISVLSRTDPAGWLVIEIRDNGQGMDSEVLQHALEPFFSTKENHPGIGLAIARGIWRRHRGTMSLESQPQAGTLVRLSVAGLPSR